MDAFFAKIPQLPAVLRSDEDFARAAEVVRELSGAAAVWFDEESAGASPGEETSSMDVAGNTMRHPLQTQVAKRHYLHVRWDTPHEGYWDLRSGQVRALAAVLAPRLDMVALQQGIGRLQSELARKDFNLYTVYHISKALGAVLNLDEVLQHITDMMAEVMTVRGCYVLLHTEDQETFTVRSAKMPVREGTPPDLVLRETEAVPEWLATIHFESRAVRDFTDPLFVRAFPNATEQLNAAAIKLLVPLIYKKRLVGMLALEEKYTEPEFETRDFEFLSILGPLAANAVSNAQLYEQAILDGLTRLYVVRYFRQRCREEIKRAYRYGKPVSLILWDIDHFKLVNDTHGHLVGDQVLRELGQLIKHASRVDVDLVARYGGEEFIMLLPETPREGAVILAERIRHRIDIHQFTRDLHVTISGGIASFPADARDYASLVARADDELFRAKRQGRNRVSYPGPLPEAAGAS